MFQYTEGNPDEIKPDGFPVRQEKSLINERPQRSAHHLDPVEINVPVIIFPKGGKGLDRRDWKTYDLTEYPVQRETVH